MERHPTSVEAVELGGIRTVVAVPMLKDDRLIGYERACWRARSPARCGAAASWRLRSKA